MNRSTALVLFAFLVSFLGALAASAATVVTDQSDYAPGSTATITGSGFTPGETVQLQVVNLTNPGDTGVEHDPWTVAADASGNFTTTWFVTDDELGATLQLTATGLTSALTAQAIFTDGNASDGTGNLTVSPTTLNAGTTNTMVFTFATDSGKDYLAHSLATIEIPAGWTAPQTNSSIALGYASVVTNGSSTQVPLTATITNISGTGPWTVYIDFSAQKGGNGFIFTYTNAVAPNTPGTNTFTVSTRNSATTGGVLTPLTAGNPSSVVVVGPPSKLGFTTTAQTLTAGVNSSTITVQIQDVGGNPTNATVARVVNLSSTSGSGVFKSMAGSTISSITIAVGQNSTNFLYNDTLAGSPTITASSTSPSTIGSATQVEKVNAAAASKLAFTNSPVTVTAGVASGNITIQRQDQYGNPVTAEGTRTVTLSSSSIGTVTFSPSSLSIATNTSTASFTYTDTKAGTPTITNISTSPSTITLATQTETVIKATPTISGVTSSQSITYGTASVSLSGTVSAPGSVYPTNGQTVSVTINSITTNAVISGGVGGFSVNFATATIPASGTPYPITYAYAGGPDLNAAANDTSTTLTVNKAASSASYSATGPFIYNKTAKSPVMSFSGSTGAKTTNYVGTSISYASVNAPTNAGAYYVSNTVAADSNFLGATNSQSFTINPTNLTITAQANTKIYDGGTSSATNALLTAGNIQTGDTAPTWTQTYDNKNAGTGKTLTPSSQVVTDGNSGNNYNYTYTAAAVGVINKATATAVLAVANSPMTYDGTGKAATVSVTSSNTPGGAQNILTGGQMLQTNVGTYAVTADYVPTDTNYTTASGIAAGNFVINPATTALVVSSSAPTNGYRDSVSFTATLPAFAAGNVQFKTNNIAFGSAVTLAGGAASSLTTTNLPRGTNIITAEYAGDSNCLGSTNDLLGGQIVTNHPPVAGLVTYGRAYGSSMRISIPTLLTNFTSDSDGDARFLVSVGASTNGSFIATNGGLILFAPTNNLAESFAYVVRDVVPGYPTGDLSLTVTNWITITITNAVGPAGLATNTGSGMNIQFAGIPGYTYDVERSTNLTSWTVVWTTNTPPQGVWIYTDSSPPAPSAFYRLRLH